MQKDVKIDEQMNLNMLNQAFQAFSTTTTKFQEAYAKLQEQIDYLSQELAEKNVELNRNNIELEQTQKYLHNILENISDGVIALNLAGEITTFNKAAQTITNFSAAEIINKRYDEIFLTTTQGRDFVNDIIQRGTLPEGRETTIKNKSGEEIPVIAYTTLITDEHSRVIGIVITFNDLTTIKQLEDQIERSKRLAALGEMAAGVAHEIRNPLGGIEMFASILERECEHDERKKKIISSILNGVRSLDKIITELLSFTRSFGKTDFHDVDVIDCIESAIEFASQECNERMITIHKKYSAVQSVMVFGNGDQLKQVILNLLLNAAQAITHKSGIVEVISTPHYTEGYVIIEVCDNGNGIKEEYVKKIFDPFFTTKSKGTGLGLAISYRIIEAHGGSVIVESKENKGTRFLIHLPLKQRIMHTV